MSALDDQQTIDSALAIDDAAIEAAAIALCWDQRPAPSPGGLLGALLSEPLDPMIWWQVHPEDERRRYRRAARVVCEAWEEFWRAHGGEGR